MNGQLNLMKVHGIDVRLDIWSVVCSSVTYLSQKIGWLATRWTVIAESPDGAGTFVFVHTCQEALWPTYRLHSGSKCLFPERKKNGPERVGNPQTDVVSGCRLHVSLPLRPISTFTKFCLLSGATFNFGTEYNKKLNSVALVRERTILTERPPPVGEVSANFCG